MEEENKNSNQQEIPRWHTSDVPKAAPIINNPSTKTVREQAQEKGEKETEIKNSEKITAKLKEIPRYQKRTFELRTVWRGFVRVGDVLDTPQMKELKAQKKI